MDTANAKSADTERWTERFRSGDVDVFCDLHKRYGLDLSAYMRARSQSELKADSLALAVWEELWNSQKPLTLSDCREWLFTHAHMQLIEDWSSSYPNLEKTDLTDFRFDASSSQREVDLPKEISAWSTFFENSIVSTRLRDVVCCVEQRSGGPLADAPSLESLIGSRYFAPVLSRGLGVLETRQLTELARYPRLLLRLQEIVFREGGEYWQGLERSLEDVTRCKNQWEKLSHCVEKQKMPEENASMPIKLSSDPTKQTSASRWRPLFLVFGPVLIAFVVWRAVRFLIRT